MPQIILGIRQFHEDMRSCVSLDYGEGSGRFPVEQDFRQGCVLPPLLFAIFFQAVIHMAFGRFWTEKGTKATLVGPRK